MLSDCMPSRSARSMAARIIRCELKGVEELNKIQEPSDPGITMRAIVQDAYGSADVLHQAEVEKPAIAANEGLVKGHAAGVDRGTGHLLAGQPYLMRIIGFGFSRPKQRVPGLDVAGTVVEVGSGVTRFRPGEDVFGIARGSFAEYAAARE